MTLKFRIGISHSQLYPEKLGQEWMRYPWFLFYFGHWLYVNYGFSINVICGKFATEKMEKNVRIKHLEKPRYLLHYWSNKIFACIGWLETTRILSLKYNLNVLPAKVSWKWINVSMIGCLRSSIFSSDTAVMANSKPKVLMIVSC